MQNKPYLPETKLFEVEEGKLSFDDSGDENPDDTKPIILCLPGIVDLKESYRFLAPLLVKEGFRVIRMDLRGLGQSSTSWKSFAASDVGSDIVALVKHLSLDNRGIIVVGNSMAAAAAVWAAVGLPKVIHGIVLIGPFVRDMPIGYFMQILMKTLFGGFWGASAWTMYYKSLYKDNPPQDLEEYIANLSRNIKEPNRFSTVYNTLFTSKESCSKRISELTTKTLVLMGSKDPDFFPPESEVKWIEENFKGLAKGVMIEGAGHYPQAEYPEICKNLIIEFVQQLI